MDLMCSSYAWEGTEKPNIETLRLDDKSEEGFFHVSFFFFCLLLPLRRIQGKLGFCLMIISAETSI